MKREAQVQHWTPFQTLPCKHLNPTCLSCLQPYVVLVVDVSPGPSVASVLAI